MWQVSNKLWIITTAPLLLVGMIFYGMMVSSEALTDDGYPLNTFLFVMGGVFIVFPLLTAFGISF